MVKSGTALFVRNPRPGEADFCIFGLSRRIAWFSPSVKIAAWAQAALVHRRLGFTEDHPLQRPAPDPGRVARFELDPEDLGLARPQARPVQPAAMPEGRARTGEEHLPNRLLALEKLAEGERFPALDGENEHAVVVVVTVEGASLQHCHLDVAGVHGGDLLADVVGAGGDCHCPRPPFFEERPFRH